MLTSLCCASLSLFSLSLRLLSFFLYFIFRSRALAHIVLSLHKLMLCWTVLWSPCSWLMVFCASSSFPTSLVFFFSDARIHLIDSFFYRLALALFRVRLKLLFFYSRISFASSVYFLLWVLCCDRFVVDSAFHHIIEPIDHASRTFISRWSSRVARSCVSHKSNRRSSRMVEH